MGIDLDTPWRDLPEEHRSWLLFGTGDRHITFEWKPARQTGFWKHGGQWEGVIPQLLSSFKKTAAGPRRMQLKKYMRVVRCGSLRGSASTPRPAPSRSAANRWSKSAHLPSATWRVVRPGARTPGDGNSTRCSAPSPRSAQGDPRPPRLPLNVGLDYLSRNRSAPTLSGGEGAAHPPGRQIGSGLVGVLYILDEPSIGLHPRDNERLLRSLLRLRDMGNTVLVVEHDEDTMRAADHIVDFGPGPGVRGGQVVAGRHHAELAANKRWPYGAVLRRQTADWPFRPGGVRPTAAS